MLTHKYTVTIPHKERRYPDNNTGLYLFTHTHDWREIGTHTWPSGDTSITFRCSRCTDVIASNNPRLTHRPLSEHVARTHSAVA